MSKIHGEGVHPSYYQETCVFCKIILGLETAQIVKTWPEAVAFLDRWPVTPGHILVVPRQHVHNVTEDPALAGRVLECAASLASELAWDSSNLIISNGVPAKQRIFHLHIHLVPRRVNDQLMVPWGTTGDPWLPHRCSGMSALEAELSDLRDFYEQHATSYISEFNT